MIRWLLPFASAALLAAPLQAHGEEGGAAAPRVAGGNVQTALALAAVKLALPRRDFVATRIAWSTRYGPFRVVGPDRVEMVGATDRGTPEQFAALLRDHPGIRRIDMVDCPGTHDDRANLRLGRMIRAAGLATHVPANGSVRSGAVDLFLAGSERVVQGGAQFAVHSWRDPQGREARDFAPDAAPNRAYLDYYRDMGMDARSARAFYDFTNSVPHRQALWLQAGEMRMWAAQAGHADRRVPVRPALASEPAGRPATITVAMTIDRLARVDLRRVALLDLSMLGGTALPQGRPALGMLDSARRL